MNWEAIGAIGEVAGAIAVFATLAYLAIQVRASTRASEVESKIATLGTKIEFLRQLAQSRDLEKIYYSGIADIEILSDDERQTFSNLLLQSFSNVSTAHFQFVKGTLDEEGWIEYLAITRFLLAGSGTRAWWNETGHGLFGPLFRDFVESEIHQLENMQGDT